MYRFNRVLLIDFSGLSNQSQYEHTTSTSKLETNWVSKAALRQRMGRAGRTSPGICYRLAMRGREVLIIDT